MARNITVSALGPPALAVSPDLDNREIVRLMCDHWRAEIERVLPEKPDLVVVPEACDRPYGFTMERRLDYYADRKEQVRQEMTALAREGHCNIAYSAARQMRDGSYRNMTELINRAGETAGSYSKNHLVPAEYDKGGILYGRAPVTIQLDCANVAPIICFDLNYTELLDQVVALKPDLILFSSMYHGGLMQSYWAYTVRAFFVGACCNLPCTVVSPVGEVLASSTNNYHRTTARINLDCAVVHLDQNWERIEAARDKYKDGFRVDDPGYLGAVLLTCEREDMTIEDMIDEFEILRIDDYLAQCRAHRKQPGVMEEA